MKSNSDDILDKVTAEIRNEKVDPAAVSAAADRVWARVSAAAGETETELPSVDRTVGRIEGCADFQSLIPAHLAGKLSEARSLEVDAGHHRIRLRTKTLIQQYGSLAATRMEQTKISVCSIFNSHHSDGKLQHHFGAPA